MSGSSQSHELPSSSQLDEETPEDSKQDSSDTTVLETPPSHIRLPFVVRFFNSKPLRILRLRYLGPCIEAAIMLVFLTLTILTLAYNSLFGSLAEFLEGDGAERWATGTIGLFGIIVWIITFMLWVIFGRKLIEPPKILKFQSQENNAFFALLNLLYIFVRLGLFIGLLALKTPWSVTIAWSLEIYICLIAGAIWGGWNLRKLIHKCQRELKNFKQ